MRKHSYPVHLFLVLLVVLIIPLKPQQAATSHDQPPEDDIIDESITLVSAEQVNPYFTVETYALSDGTTLHKDIINGPPKPPPGFETEREASLTTLTTRGTLSNFPSYNWVFGCSAVSGAMIAGYYDRTDYPNMYAGPTNGGLMPITDTSWTTWKDTTGTWYVNNPLVASKDGVDGRIGRGSIDNYWVSYASTAPDPYLSNSWTQHTWGTAIGDYMKTSRSPKPYESIDGSTWFWGYGDATQLTCSAMETIKPSGETYPISEVDGTYGRKLFYEARGYAVTSCYNQKTDNLVSGGFSLSDFKAQIDAGHPVLLNLQGHSIVGFSYSGSTIYIRDTWDSNPNNVYSMPWGGSYAGMTLRSVSIVRLDAPAPTPSDEPSGVSASNDEFSDRVRVSWNSQDDAMYYKVYRNTSDSHTDETELTNNHTDSPYDDFSAVSGQVYYYWVKACNSAGCSGYSLSDTGFWTDTAPQEPASVFATDGVYTDRININWEAIPLATYYKIFRNTTESHAGEIELSYNHPDNYYNDKDVMPDQIYYYWVKACNSAGCSDYCSCVAGKRSSGFMIYLPMCIK